MNKLRSTTPQRLTPSAETEDSLENVSCLRFIGGLVVVCLPLLLATPSSASYQSFYSAIVSIPTLLKSAVSSRSSAVAPAPVPAPAPVSIPQKKIKSISRAEIWKSVQFASSKYQVEPSLIMAVIAVGSKLNPRAVSSDGAMGLMQLMPKTAKEMGVHDPFNAYDNVLGGTRYLCYLLSKYRGDTELALAAYHAGTKAVKRYRGVPPYRKTKNFVKEVMKLASR